MERNYIKGFGSNIYKLHESLTKQQCTLFDGKEVKVHFCSNKLSFRQNLLVTHFWTDALEHKVVLKIPQILWICMGEQHHSVVLLGYYRWWYIVTCLSSLVHWRHYCGGLSWVKYPSFNINKNVWKQIFNRMCFKKNWHFWTKCRSLVVVTCS